MKFNIKFFKKKGQSPYFIRRHYSVPSMNLVRASIVIMYNHDDVKDDNDVLYLIMKKVDDNYNVKLLPDQIQLLN